MGGFSGLRDMSGNVAEWVDNCKMEPMQNVCRVRGGKVGDGQSQMRCDGNRWAGRYSQFPFMGLRCCKDLVVQ